MQPIVILKRAMEHSLTLFAEEERHLESGLGVKIVLTASATEMSDFFNNHFIAFFAGFGKGPLPLSFMRKTVYPPVERNA